MTTTTIASPKQRISTTAILILAVVIGVSFLLPSTLYNQLLQSYLLNDATTIVYNTMVDNGTDATVLPVVVLNDEAYRRFLELTEHSNEPFRKWLNSSLSQVGAIVKFNHSSQTPSSVVYKACCGLGHRLTRLEDAAHVAMLYDATLEVMWNDCGSDTFQTLFGPEPLRLGEIQSKGYSWTFSNNVPECYGLASNSELCQAILYGKTKASTFMYQSLLDRYLRRNVVEEFIQKHFHGFTSIGMHIRAGNNETGDFTRKNRHIADMDAFVKLNADRIRSMVTSPAVLFIATDTPSYVQAFRAELNDTMKVVELQQVRAQDGAGVMFGEHGAEKPKGQLCLEGWHAALQDMMILASTDIVFASTYSSFTRTMPRVLALTRPNRRVNESFCENWKDESSRMVCYSSLDDFNANPPPMKRIRR